MAPARLWKRRPAISLVHMQKLLRAAERADWSHPDTGTEPVFDQASLEELARVLATYDLTIVPTE